ncbi:MAG: ABC transporter permease [Bacteriovoracaceae bacterium]|nr:ABC transporter permease [Bacteriovoracaceae bacterium]
MESAQTADFSQNTSKTKVAKSKSLWQHAFSSLLKDKIAVIAFSFVLLYAVVALGAGLGIIASDWTKEIGPSYAAPTFKYILGTDIFGRSVALKAIKGTQVAMLVGLFTAMLSITIGVTLGAIAGYFGGRIDEFIVWFYTTFSSIPYIMLLMTFAFILGKGVTSVCLALGLSSWVSLCRLIRGEVIRHKDREYVHAAAAIGGGDFRKLFLHILPNVFHIVIINFSLTFQMAIKSEVILSYLGIGVQELPSWGRMIDEAKDELARGVWWQLAAAALAMFIIVLAFNLLGDALRDALDPKLKGK